MSETPHEKVARLGKLRRAGGVLRAYRAPRRGEPCPLGAGRPEGGGPAAGGGGWTPLPGGPSLCQRPDRVDAPDGL